MRLDPRLSIRPTRANARTRNSLSISTRSTNTCAECGASGQFSLACKSIGNDAKAAGVAAEVAALRETLAGKLADIYSTDVGDFPQLTQHLWLGTDEGEAVAAALRPKLSKTKGSVEELLSEVVALEVGDFPSALSASAVCLSICTSPAARTAVGVQGEGGLGSPVCQSVCLAFCPEICLRRAASDVSHLSIRPRWSWRRAQTP
jgi:hypothetical protein